MIKIVTNPDKDFVKEIREKLKENNGYCPCSIVKNKDTICMCKDFKEQIAQGVSGECHCGLFVVVEE